MRILISIISILFLGQLFAQTGIKGTVLDERSGALIGATVLIGEKTAVTDIDGKFRIETEAGEQLVLISYVGKKRLEELVEINGMESVTFIMMAGGIPLDEVLVRGIRADEKTPMTFSTITEEDLESRNLGQDLPILLNYLPSVVTTSDAGGGVGYTGIRVRGSDATRVNVTINGIPYNDSESQGTFWVDLPDFASSVENAQLQRGIGTSTNGAGAFGASLNLLTEGIDREAGGVISNSFGSFNTRKHTLEYNTGQLNDHISLSGRLSRIASDGYIDRATSDLSSYFLQAAYVSDKTIIKALVFGGKEETYLAWNGIDAETLKSDRTANFSGAYTDDQGELQFYDNEVDHYDQDHYQLLLNRTLDEGLTLNLAGHYTWGRGYYEQFKEDASLPEYGISPLLIDSLELSTSDIIRRKWLDNDFYGFTTSLDYDRGTWEAVLGGGWNQYKGDHFGEVVWAEYASDSEIRDRYYDNIGNKEDAHVYLKTVKTVKEKWNLFADLQLRSISYEATGVSEERVEDDFLFFNPKFGLTYVQGDDVLYLSYAHASREPNRTDYENGNPVPEVMEDLELGWRASREKMRFNANLYFMYYTDQLVLTGALDEVGSPIRQNIGKSYRAGIELDCSLHLSDKFSLHPNITLSRNRNLDYQDESADGLVALGDTEIGFSPSIIAGNAISFRPSAQFEISLLTKYVGEQFMGNVEAEESILDKYLVNDLSLSYSVQPKSTFENIRVNVLVNNVFDESYVSNGYWGPGYVGYYPQAGINFLVGLSLEF